MSEPFDFWTVKNVSGRFLVGLRWWNETNSDGESIWIFESADPQNKQNSTDSKVFWFVLYLVPIIWIIFGIVAILRLNFIWLIIIIIALFLSGANALACNKDQKNKWMENISGKFLSSNYSSSLFRKMGSSLFRRFF